MELKDRLKLARKKVGLTQSQVAQVIKGLSQPAYSELERGLSKSTTKVIELANLFEVNPIWLSTGQGEMELDNHHVHASQVNSGNFHNSSINQNVQSSQVFHQVATQVDIPLYQNANITTVGTYTINQNLLKGEPQNLFAVPVLGREMQPLLMDKAMAIADKSKVSIGIYDGQVYALQMGESIRCRYLEVVAGGRVRVYSEQNKEGETFDQAEFDKHYQILGGIVWQSSFFGW